MQGFCFNLITVQPHHERNGLSLFIVQEMNIGLVNLLMDRLQEILACVVRVLLNEEIIVKSKIFPQIDFFQYGKIMKRALQEPTKKNCVKKKVKCGLLELRNRYPPELVFYGKIKTHG